MKKILILILMLSVKICAQEQIANEKVDNYLNFLKSYADDEQKLLEIPKVSESELKKYVKLKYGASEDDYKTVYTKIYDQSKEVEKTRKGKDYSYVSSYFRQILDKRYPRDFVEFLLIPYLVKARITAIKDSSYSSEEGVTPQLSMMTKVLTFDVLEVLKGKNEFQAGKTYKCYYGNNWRKFGSDKFAEGGTYLLALDPRMRPNSRAWSNALITYLDDNCGLFKIEDGDLYDKYNFFSLGNVVPWTDFVSGYNKKVEAIKNGDF